MLFADLTVKVKGWDFYQVPSPPSFRAQEQESVGAGVWPVSSSMVVNPNPNRWCAGGEGGPLVCKMKQKHPVPLHTALGLPGAATGRPSALPSDFCCHLEALLPWARPVLGSRYED